MNSIVASASLCRMRLLCAVLLLVGVTCTFGKLAVSNVDRCVQATLKNKLTNDIPKRGKRQFFLYFGDAGIEAAEVFTPDDVRRVTALAKCTAGEDNALFEDRTNSMYHFHDGGSNVTYLTGLFQTIFPELDRKLRVTAQKAIERAEWKGDMTQYGIRSVQYLSFYKAGLKAHRAALKVKKPEDEAPAFIIYPDQDSRLEADKLKLKKKHSKFDPDADEVVKVHLQPVEPPNAVAFTAIIQLTDRAQFAGGDILVSKNKHSRTTISLHKPTTKTQAADSQTEEEKEQEQYNDQISGYDLDEDANYDDPDPEEDETDTATKNAHTDTTKTQNSAEKDAAEQEFAVFDAETTTISRYTPELGSLFLVHGEHARGMRPVLYGRRNSLIIEYWAFSDGEVGAKRPSLSEAKPLKSNSMQDEL